MIRQLLHLLTLAVPGLVIGACATPSPPPVSSTTASATSATSATSTSTAAPGRYCPWCPSNIPIDNDKNHCKLFVQMPEDFSKIFNYPVLLFNNDLTQLVKAEFISTYDPRVDWYLNPNPGNRKSGITVVIMPLSAIDWDQPDQPPKIAINRPGMNHNGNWTIVHKAGELAHGVQSTLFYTTVPCGR